MRDLAISAISIEDFLAQHGEEIGNPNSEGPSASPAGLNRECKHRDGANTTTDPKVLSSAEFVRGFVPPDYVISGILQRGFLYSCTGPTGSGKTTIALRLLAATALGHALGGREVEQGKCLMLVGENPDDVRMRWIALAEQMGFLADEIDVYFRPGVGPIAELMPDLQQKALEVGGFSLVVVDTAAAFFDGDDENSNKQQGDYARLLRTLTGLHGRPCVLVNCHPTKNAGPDNLLPRGGGAFVAEVDGNLCCTKSGSVAELHWQGKFRGPDFAPIPFELLTVTSDRLKDSKGRPLPTVYAKSLTEQERESRETETSRDQQKVLAAMYENPDASVASLATSLRWVSTRGEPLKSKVHRLLVALRKQKLADQQLDHWVLTVAGEKIAKKLANVPASE